MKHGLQKVSLETLMSESDAIITAPTLNPTSRHIINATSLAWVKPGATLVNIARGGLVEEQALAAAIKDGRHRVRRAGRPRGRAAEPRQ